MPKIPKWAADAMESVLGNMFPKVSVHHISYLNPLLKKITFKGDLSKIKFKTGQAIILRVDDTNYRNYTPSFWDSAEGQFEIIFHLHGNGPGSRYISGLNINDALTISQPRGFDLYKKDHNYHFFFGDETAIGFFKSLKNRIEENAQNYIGVLELDNNLLNSDIDFGCMLDKVSKSGNKAENAILYLENLSESVWQLWKNGMFYLMGNARSIQNFRKTLKEKGVSSRNIITQPYWVEGKTGL
jgi:NADPH-dependent ferric siderophore reductase